MSVPCLKPFRSSYCTQKTTQSSHHAKRPLCDLDPLFISYLSCNTACSLCSKHGDQLSVLQIYQVSPYFITSAISVPSVWKGCFLSILQLLTQISPSQRGPKTTSSKGDSDLGTTNHSVYSLYDAYLTLVGLLLYFLFLFVYFLIIIFNINLFILIAGYLFKHKLPVGRTFSVLFTLYLQSLEEYLVHSSHLINVS